MAEATLKYNLNEEFEEAAFLGAVHGVDMAHMLTDIREYVRGKLKYAEISKETEEVLEEVSEIIRNGPVDLDKIIF